MTLAQDVKDTVQELIKAKKNLRIYPENNPVYARTINNVYSRMTTILDSSGSLSLKIKQHDIFLAGETVYHSDEKEENLALFFFKDGIRELTFNQGLPKNEMEDFLRILSVDFEREVSDDDIVTLMWEKDFQFIHYIVDDSILLEDETYEERAIEEAKKASANNEGILNAYEDAFGLEKESGLNVVPITDEDLGNIIREIENDPPDKSITLIHLLFEMLSYAEGMGEYKELTGFISSALEFAINLGNLEAAVYTFKKIGHGTAEDIYGKDAYVCLKELKTFINSARFIKLLGEILDEGAEFNEELLYEFASLLDKRAILPFIHILGELRNAPARKAVISILSELGKKDIPSIAQGMHDRRWYVVRNIICILRQIGDTSAVEYLTRAVRHPDRRVKKEAIRTLGVMGTGSVLPVLKDCMSDSDELVRLAAVRAIGLIGTPVSKKIILDRITDRSFRDKSYNEKKEFYEVLAKWKDSDVIDLLIKSLKRKTLFKRTKNVEIRAAAAHGLGIIGTEEALETLMKLRNSKNKLLRENIQSAIKRITDEKNRS
ncbi:MAG: PBS lyase [bacterium]|nr:MAG: PBS lyase [bacterium]